MTALKKSLEKFTAFLFAFTLAVGLSVVFSPAAAAGTSDSSGTGSGSGTGGASNPYGVYNSHSGGGLLWYNMPAPGSRIYCNLYSTWSRSMVVPANTTKGLYLTIGNKLNTARTWLNWGYWRYYIGTRGPYNLPSFPNSAYDVRNVQTSVANKGKLIDPDLVTEVLKNYIWNSYRGWYNLRTNSNVHMDAVWVSATPSTDVTTRDVIVKVVSNTGPNTRTDLDDTGLTLASLYSNGRSNASSTLTSDPNMYSEDFSISYVVWSVTQTQTYTTDGVSRWDISNSYSRTVKGTYSKSFEYTITPPDASTSVFVPFNANTESASDINTVNAEYGPNFVTSSSRPLDMTVTNYQHVTDGTDISILDNNDANGIYVTYNDQFGIPTTGVGGLDLRNYDSDYFDKYKNANGTYSSTVFNDSSITSTSGCAASSTLSQNNVTFNTHNESCSNDVSWTGPSLRGGIVTDNVDKTGVVLGSNPGGEYLPGSYLGGTSTTAGQTVVYYIKAITTQQVDLSSPSGRDFFEVSYEKAIFFAYGANFNVDINATSGFADPSNINYGIYTGANPMSFTQPILESHWIVKTVGGGYEN